MSNDSRKNFILKTSANFFSKKTDDFVEKFSNEKNIDKFLDDFDISLLIVNISPEKEVTFTVKVTTLKSN
jgi:hypothetical protein